MARNYHVEGTKAYLYWALGLALFGLWCVRDGWFPSASVLDKHPSPGDSFYLFNRICAVISLVGAAVCAYIHRVVK
jgi:hypothetical protein